MSLSSLDEGIALRGAQARTKTRRSGLRLRPSRQPRQSRLTPRSPAEQREHGRPRQSRPTPQAGDNPPGKRTRIPWPSKAGSPQRRRDARPETSGAHPHPQCEAPAQAMSQQPPRGRSSPRPAHRRPVGADGNPRKAGQNRNRHDRCRPPAEQGEQAPRRKGEAVCPRELCAVSLRR
jgi:hypothetical protein